MMRASRNCSSIFSRKLWWVTLITLSFAQVFGVAIADDEPFYLSIDTPPAPELSPEEAMQSFRTAPGYSVQLVAAEPLVEDPVAIAWDERGDLYVVEMRGYMPDAYGNGEKDPVGMVVRLKDTDHDGNFDVREVLLDKLILPRALAIVNEGLLVGEPPHLWLCPSATGSSADIDCSAKRKLGTYGDQPGSVEHAENGLMTGLDNWLYSAKSNRRLRLVGDQLVVEPTLFRGQWGIAQDNDGRLYYNTNSNLLLGDAYDAQPIVAAGNATAPGLGARVSTNDQLFAVRVNTGVNRAYVPGVLRADGRLNRPTSASGTAPYRGNQFPADNLSDVFVAEPAANAIAQLRLKQNGLSVSAEHLLYDDEKWGKVEFFASTDERFRPVDLEVGPDGALYVIDMYRGIIQDHFFLSDELRAQVLARQLDKPVGMGRIWRITAGSGSDVRQRTPAEKKDLSLLSSKELVALLGHDNAWQRETAQRLLLARLDDGLDKQLEQAATKGAPLQAVHAIWTLSGRDALRGKTVRAAFESGDTSVRLSAIRAGHSKLSRKRLLQLAKETADPVVRQQLTMSLGTHNNHADVQNFLISSLIAHSQDLYLPAAIRAAAFRQELALVKGLSKTNAWGGDLEAKTGFVKQLVAQGFRAQPQTATALLDFVRSLDSKSSWLQTAVLDGLSDVSRDAQFERVVLSQPHPLFDTSDPALWPIVARARRAFTWSGDELAADAKPLSPSQQEHRAAGAQFYAGRCASCHGAGGKGIASLAPPLADSPWVTGPAERLARIMLHGLQGPIEVDGTTWNGVMPGHAAQKEFDDQVASGLITHLHRSWGHSGRAVEPAFTAQIRAATSERRTMWTALELLEIDINTHYKRYVGRFGSPEFVLEFVYDGQALNVKSGIFNGVMTPLKEDHFVFEPRGLRVEFVLDNTGKVVGLRMPRGDGEVQLPLLP